MEGHGWIHYVIGLASQAPALNLKETGDTSWGREKLRAQAGGPFVGFDWLQIKRNLDHLGRPALAAAANQLIARAIGGGGCGGFAGGRRFGRQIGGGRANHTGKSGLSGAFFKLPLAAGWQFINLLCERRRPLAGGRQSLAWAGFARYASGRRAAPLINGPRD